VAGGTEVALGVALGVTAGVYAVVGVTTAVAFTGSRASAATLGSGAFIPAP